MLSNQTQTELKPQQQMEINMKYQKEAADDNFRRSARNTALNLC